MNNMGRLFNKKRVYLNSIKKKKKLIDMFVIITIL